MSYQSVVDAQMLNRNAVAAACWSVYEAVIVFHQEVDLVWRFPRWRNAVQFLYLFARYAGLLFSILFATMSLSRLEIQGCEAYTVIAVIGPMVVSIPADALLCMRVGAIHQNDFYDVIFNYYFVQKVAGIAIFGVSARYAPSIPLSPHVTGCFPTTSQTAANAMPLLVPALYNTILFLLILFELGSWTDKTPLIVVFLRDGILYYLTVLCLILVQLIVSLCFADRVVLVNLAVPWLIAAYPIACCRIMLNLRASLRASRDEQEASE